MKNTLVIFCLFFLSRILFAQPVINSFQPLAATPLSQVVISGSGFSNVADSNIVYFGAVRAAVNAASANQLTVTVPYGASYAPLSITAGRLTGFSSLSFNPTTNIVLNEFDSTSFDTLFVIPFGSPRYSISQATINLYDINADGRQDIICTDSFNLLSLVKNNSKKGVLNSSSFHTEKQAVTDFSLAAEVADLDGDGKKDISAALNYLLPILQNRSVMDTFSFSSADISLDDQMMRELFAYGDLDGDGKTDLAGVTAKCCLINEIRIFKNSTPVNGNINFDTLPVLHVSFNPPHISSIAIADINMDNKPDIIYGKQDSLLILKNTSNGGSISFDVPLDFSAIDPLKIKVADLDNDGKPDIVCSNATGRISIFLNTSTADNISFAPEIDLFTGYWITDMTVSDFDGDGKVDIACAVNVNFSASSFVALFKNLSVAGNINFSSPASYKVNNIKGMTTGDIDGDGKQDIIVGCDYDSKGTLAVLRNKIGEATLTLCPGNNTGSLISSLGGASYSWQISTDSIHFTAISDDTHFSGSQTASLQLINIPTAWYGYQFRCLVDGKYDKVFTLAFKNFWTGTIDTTWENAVNWSCGTLPDANTDVLIQSGNALVNSNVSCRSVTVAPDASFTVMPGFNLNVTH